MLIYLMEITYYDAATFQPVTLRFCSGEQGYTTLPTDSPANTFYDPRLKVPGDFQCHIFKDGLTGGSADGGYGVAQLSNADGFFDKFMFQAWDGQQQRILWGDSAGPYSGFVPLLTGTMCQPEFSWRTCNVKVRDYTEMFDKPISQSKFLGNNVGGVGIEGTPDDLMGKSKPLCFGTCYNVTPAWVSQSFQIYQVHDGRIKAIDAVYSNGTAWPLDTSVGTAGDCATLAALQAATPANGKYCTCLALGLFKISGGASSDITADVRGAAPGGVFASDAASIGKLISTDYIRRKRTNVLLWSEKLTDAPWATTGGSMTASSAVPPPIAGMGVNAFAFSGAGPFRVSCVSAQGTGMWCYSIFVNPGASGISRFRVKISDHASPTNNVVADINTDTGTVMLLQANGQAVGPQYTATGFITDGGVVAYPGGWFRLWVAGQPNQTFSSMDCVVSLLSGTDASYSETFSRTGTVYMTGGQFEAYSSPSAYTGPTTTLPVSGYDPAIGPTINSAPFDALAAQAPYPVGYYVAPGETTTAGALMNALLVSIGGYWAWDRHGSIIVGRFDKPPAGAAPVAHFSESEILEDSLERVPAFDSKDGTRAFRVCMSTVCNWTTQSKSVLASSMWTSDPTRVSWLSRQWREVRAEDMTVLMLHPLACELSLTSYLTNQADALAEAKRLLAIYSGQLDRFTFVTKLGFCTEVSVGSVVSISINTPGGPRFGLGDGKNFLVIGITEAHESGHATLEVIG